VVGGGGLRAAREDPGPALFAAMERLTAAAFGQRRKMLRGSLKALGGRRRCSASAASRARGGRKR
jgi:16S rRNA (adenine1518-N6/adenine1519-N6)-dimethyltransferase